MTANLLDTIYTKKVEDFSKEELDYIKKLLINNKSESLKRFMYFGLPVSTTVVGGLIGFLVGAPIIGVVLGFFSGGVISLRCANEASFSHYPLKELGINKQEWQELKKSGRLKELERMVKGYENSDNSKKCDLQNENEYIESQLKNNGKERVQANINLQTQSKIQNKQNNTNNSLLEK